MSRFAVKLAGNVYEWSTNEGMQRIREKMRDLRIRRAAILMPSADGLSWEELIGATLLAEGDTLGRVIDVRA